MKKTAKKNVWLVILAMVLVFGMTVVGCGGDDGGDPSPFKTNLQNGELRITGYDGTPPANLVFPASIDGKPVYGIANFQNMGLNSITIPEGIIRIESKAFASNDELFGFAKNNLTAVIIPNSVNFIGDYAFDGNPIISITIGANVSIESHSFPGGKYSTVGGIVTNTLFWFVYETGGAGTYTRANTDENSPWIKQSNGGNTSQKTLVIQGLPQTLVESVTDLEASMVGIFVNGTTTEQALSQTGLVAGNELDDDEVTLSDTYPATATIHLTLPGGNTPWTGNGLHMIYIVLVTADGGRYFATGPVDFSSATTTISYNASWEISL